MLQGYMTSKEAAEYINRTDSLIRKLCKAEKLPGAVKVGNTWLIPEETVKGYKPAPTGFAVVWTRRRELALNNGLKEEQL